MRERSMELTLWTWLAILGGLLSLALSEVRVAKDPQGKLRYELPPTALLPEKAKKELDSGLTTQILILARILDPSDRIVDQQVLNFSVKYDLWEEKYWMEGPSGIPKRSFSTRSDVEHWIEGPGPFDWVPVSSLKPELSYRIEVLETVNPVSRQQLESVQKWLTEQRVTARGGSPDSHTSDIAVGKETPFSALFYDLWKRAAAGDQAGEIQRSAKSEPFRASALPIAPEASR